LVTRFKSSKRRTLSINLILRKIGLNLDESDINGYWYSFNWSQQTRYKPRLYPKFDGVYKDNAELLTFNRISSEPYFPQPDYLSGLQYAHLEEELSNSAINRIEWIFSR
jgi:uncharacterized protein (DUF2225 family)